MSKRPLRIAIYSGEIPSTTFIERLIEGLASADNFIYLFGVRKKKTATQKNILVVSYTHQRFVKLVHLLKYSVLLMLFKPRDKRKLDCILQTRSKNNLYSKVKYYPVLWHRPDIFHIQWAKALEDWMWVQEFGIKLVLSLRGAHINYSPIANPDLAAMYQRYFPQVDGFHAVSQAMTNEAVSYGAASERIKVVYSGLGLEMIKNTKRTDGIIQILSVGRPHWIKGYHYALDAMSLLKSEGVAFEYHIIGGGDSEELLYQVGDLELEQEVTLLGALPFKEVQKRVQMADVLLLSSVEEGIANVVLEAMQLGTLVLSTECGGMREVITDGTNGFLVPIRNPRKIADALKDILELSQMEKDVIIESAKNTISQRYSEAQMVAGMMGLYEEVFGS